MSVYIKWKCSHCGKIEYRSTLVGCPPGSVCKKGAQNGGHGNFGRGPHYWTNVGVVAKKTARK